MAAALGDVLYRGASLWKRLVGNTTTTKKYLSQTGSGAASAAPAWAQVADADLAVSDITTNNVSVTAHGFVPKAPNDGTQYLDGTGAWSVPSGTGSGSPPPSGAAVMDVVGQTDIVNTAAETTAYSLSIPGNTLGVLRLTLAADYLNNSGAGRTFTLRIKYGATTIYDDVTASMVAGATRRGVLLTVLLGNASGTSDQFLAAQLQWGSVGSGTTAGSGDLALSPGALVGYGSMLWGSAAENSTASKTLDVTIQHSTNHASLSFRRQWAVLEALS